MKHKNPYVKYVMGLLRWMGLLTSAMKSAQSVTLNLPRKIINYPFQEKLYINCILVSILYGIATLLCH